LPTATLKEELLEFRMAKASGGIAIVGGGSEQGGMANGRIPFSSGVGTVEWIPTAVLKEPEVLTA
jgi:hypothetical protein